MSGGKKNKPKIPDIKDNQNSLIKYFKTFTIKISDQVQDISQKVEKLVKEVKDSRTDLTTALEKYSTQDKQLQALTNNNSDLQEKVNHYETEVINKDTKINELSIDYETKKENYKTLENDFKNLKNDSSSTIQNLEQQKDLAKEKISRLITNKNTLNEGLKNFEKNLFTSSNLCDALIFDAFIILDSLVSINELVKTKGNKTEDVFTSDTEKELAQLYSVLICKAFNEPNGTLSKEDLQKLVEIFNTISKYYEILQQEEKARFQLNIHKSLNSDDDPSARVTKYYTLPIKPKTGTVQGSNVVKALVDAS